MEREESPLIETYRLAHERLCQTLEAARIGTWDWDLVTNEMYWSENLEAVIGVNKPLARTLESFLSMVAPEDQPLIQSRIQQVLEQTDKDDVDPMEFRVGPAPHRWIEGVGRLFRDESGRPIRMMGTIMDVTRRRLADDEMRRASEAKSSFLANMSHEMRTPLNGVIGMVELLLQTNVTEQQRGFLDTLSKSAESLLSLVTDVLDISKIEAGALELEEIDFDVRQVARDALDVIASQAELKRLTLICDLAPNLPSQVTGDPGRLRQILLNLLSNAVKFTASGSVTLRLRMADHADESKPDSNTTQQQLLSSELGKNQSSKALDSSKSSSILLKFEVEDTGIGIAPDRQRAIFEAFTQAEASTTRTHGGTGLGLTISARLVQCMGGRITLTSVLRQGSKFEFTIPMRPAIGRVPESDSTEQDHGEDFARVLLAEDNVVNQQVLTLLLEKAGYRVDVANNGREALEFLERTPYDLVLMDVQMPEMDGLRATRLIRQREKVTGGHVPIVAVTANAVQGERYRCIAAGMDDYLPKPVRSAELFSIMSRLLDPRRRGREPFGYDLQGAEGSSNWLSPLENMGFDRAAIEKLVWTFLDTIPPRLATLRRAVQQRQAEEVRQIAHSLKGSLTVFDVQQSIELAQQLEQSGREDELGIAENLLDELDKQVEPLLASMKKFVGGIAPSSQKTS